MTTYTTCPELVDGKPCGLPAEITRRTTLESTDGPLIHIGTMCVLGHVLFMPEDRE